MYSILIKDKSNLYRFLTIKQEILQEVTKEITDPETKEVRNETSYVGTGEYETVRFETESRDELEDKCIEIFGTYNKNEFMAVNTEPFKIDLIWGSETKKEE